MSADFFKRKTIPTRKAAPSINIPVSRVLKSFVKKKNDHSWQIKQIWNLIVGEELTDLCTAGPIRNLRGKKSLIIYCSNGAVIMQLRLRSDEIIKNLNKLFPKFEIEDIYVKNRQ